MYLIIQEVSCKRLHGTHPFLFQQFIWVGGHGTVLGADVGGDLNGDAMSLWNGLTVEDAAHERACEGVASAYRVGHFHLRRFLEGDVTGSQHT